ncbi:hypothetical protein SAMN05661010_02520 [Modicisalibacter muralis]|uniref:Gp37 protein n=1 Tax=Modicisalibacter muralis TaxID=119000 RepID=A0A1G9MUF3_9GAMM|nr:hypothetical protein [Halomonas muralis]SDL77753.1 hypothetical protein SAMN05661010_02520 [Halomonas muralis]
MAYDVIDAVIDRVRTQCPIFATVDEAWFAAPIDDLGAETPAALIYLAEDGVAGEAETLRPVQAVTLTYGLWILCPHAQFRQARSEVRAALFGHAIDEIHNPLEYRGGQTTDIRGEFIWWREFWTTDTWLHDGPV